MRHTGSAIWSDAITHLAAQGCCVILATHQLHYASRREVSRVVSLGDCAVPREKNGHATSAAWSKTRQKKT